MAAAPTARIEADVTFRRMLGIFPKWGIRPRPGSERYFQGQDIHLDMGTGPYEIAFYFDNGGHDRQWRTGDEIWVSENRCPETPGLVAGITNGGVSGRTGALTIRDPVNQAGEFHYSLNFKKGNGAHRRWDPIIIHD